MGLFGSDSLGGNDFGQLSRDVEQAKVELEEKRRAEETLGEYLSSRGEFQQLAAWNEYETCMKLKRGGFLNPTGDAEKDAKNRRLYTDRADRVREWAASRKRTGMRVFPDVERFRNRMEEEKRDKIVKAIREHWDSVFCGDMAKMPEEVRRDVEQEVGGEWGDDLTKELRARSLLLGWALEEGGYSEDQVKDQVGFVDRLADKVRGAGYEIDPMRPAQGLYKYMSDVRREDRAKTDLFNAKVEEVRRAALRGEDASGVIAGFAKGADRETAAQVVPELRWRKMEAENVRKRVAPLLPVIMPAFDAMLEQADEWFTSPIYDRGRFETMMKGAEALRGLDEEERSALLVMLEQEDHGSYLGALRKALNRGGHMLKEGAVGFTHGAAAYVDEAVGDMKGARANQEVAGLYKELSGFVQGEARPVTRKEYGWFGNGVLGAVQSAPLSALAFMGPAGVTMMGATYAGDSFGEAAARNPKGDPGWQFGAAVGSGAVQGALDFGGAMVAKGVLGLKGSSEFMSKLMNRLDLSRQAMRARSGFVRGAGRGLTAGAAVTVEEGVTEKLQDLPDPFFHALAGTMGDYDPNIDWDKFWKDYRDYDANMELFGSVLAFGLVGAGARYARESGFQRGLSQQQGVLRRVFNFEEDLLKKLRTEADPEVRFELLQEGLRDFMEVNYGRDLGDGAVQLSNMDGLEKLAKRGGVELGQVYNAANDYAVAHKLGVDKVAVVVGDDARVKFKLDHAVELDGLEGRQGAQTVNPEGSFTKVYVGQLRPRESTLFQGDSGGKVLRGVYRGRGASELANLGEWTGRSETGSAWWNGGHGGFVKDKVSGGDLGQAMGGVTSQEFYHTGQGGADGATPGSRLRWVEQQNIALAALGLAPVQGRLDEESGRMVYDLTLDDGTVESFDDYTQAMERLSEECMMVEEGKVADVKGMAQEDSWSDPAERVRSGANEEMMKHLDDEGMMREGQVFDRSKEKTPMTLGKLKLLGVKYREVADARAEIFAQQEGIEQGLVGDDLRVYGVNVVEVMRDHTYQAVQKLFAGANPLDVFEERVEGIVGYLLHEGEWRVEQFESALKELEQATGDKYLVEGKDRMLAVKEGVSRAARANLLGQIKDERLPDLLRKWFRRLILWFGHVMEYRNEMERARKMMKPEVRRQVDARFMRLLQDMAGLDEDARVRRYEKEERAQIMAEAYGGLDEIGDWAAGKMMRPKEAREMGDDLAGELQRIYDAKVKNVRRTARRRDGAAGRVFEQRSVMEAERFFAKDGMSVAELFEAAQEAGFPFEDSGEMLSAIYDSLVYGRKIYATRGMSEETMISMSTGGRGRGGVTARNTAGDILSAETFVTRPDGNPDWFMIPSRKGRKEMPVRLLIGEDRGKHKGYGLTHIAASRDLDGLWANTSPEKYLSSILTNVSELWELAPGRELLVRGKRPSSWMALQLVEEDGYYSIITAYPVEQNKKPKGKKIPLAERASDKNQREARHRQPSTNPDAAPSAFPGGQENKSATLASTAGEGLVSSVPQGTKSVNINDTTLHFDDGRAMPASLSLSEAKEKGLFKDGHLEAGNAVITEPGVSFSIRALHASPHSFRKFDTAFMGTGEWAQAYGWGLYFAESEEVNRAYLNQFARDASTWRFQDLRADSIGDMARKLRDRIPFPEHINRLEEGVLDTIYSVLGDLSDARGDKGKIEAIREELREDIRINEGYSDKYPQAKRQAEAENVACQYLLDYLDEIEAASEISSNYRVELNVDEDSLLNWDSEQTNPDVAPGDDFAWKISSDLALKGFSGLTPANLFKELFRHMEDHADFEGFRENFDRIVEKYQDYGELEESDLEGYKAELEYWAGYVYNNVLTGKQVYRSFVAAFGSDAKASKALLEEGIKGIRYEDGLSRWEMVEEKTYNYVIFDGNDIKITAYADGSTKGEFVDYTDTTASFSLGNRSGGSVWDYLAEAATDGAREKVRVMEVMKDRLGAALKAYGFSPDGTYLTRWVAGDIGIEERGVMRERERVQAVLGVMDAIMEGLPGEVRGRLRVDTLGEIRRRAVEAKTKKGRMNAVRSLVQSVDRVLEGEVAKRKLEQLDRLMNWAQAKSGENRVLRGKLTVEVQQKFDRIRDIMSMDQAQLEKARDHAEAEVGNVEDFEDEGYVRAVEDMMLLDVFGGLRERNMYGGLVSSSVRMERALEMAQEVYARGRAARNILEENRVETVRKLREDAGRALGLDRKLHVNERTGAVKHDVGLVKSMQNVVRNALSFEDMLRDVFGDGTFTKHFSDGVRRARLQFNAQRMARQVRYYQKLGEIAGVLGDEGGVRRKVDGQVKAGVRRKVDLMVKELSVERSWGVDVPGEGAWIRQEIDPDSAQKFLDGEMDKKAIPDWLKTDEGKEALVNAMEAWAQRPRKEKVVVEWFEKGKDMEPLMMSDLEVAYVLQLSRMPEYVDNLEQEGFGLDVLEELWEKIDPRAWAIAEYFCEEYEADYARYNKVYRGLFGVDLPKVMNYAPGMFSSENKADVADPTESRGSGWLSVGSIKGRRMHRARPQILSAVNVYWSHTMQMDHWAEFAPVVRELKAVMLDPVVKDKLAKKEGADALKLMLKWVEKIEFDGSREGAGGKLTEAVQRILSAQATGALSYNLKTCVKQLPAAFSSFADMSPGEALQGFVGMVSNPGQLKHVWGSDVIQQRIMQGMSPEMRSALTASKMHPGLLAQAMEMGMLPISLTDAAFTSMSGCMAYEAARVKALRRGESDEVARVAAEEALDRAVRRTAQPIETEQKSLWEIEAGALGRAMMMFRSDPRKQLALSYLALSQGAKGEIGKGSAAWRFFNSWVMYGVFNQLVVDGLMWAFGKGDDPGEDWWKDYLISGACGALSGIYGLSELVQYAAGKILGKDQPKFDNGMEAQVDQLVRGVGGIRDLMAGDGKDFGKVMNRVGRAVNGMGVLATIGVPQWGSAIQAAGRVTKENLDVYNTWWSEEGRKAKEVQRVLKEVRQEEKEAKDAKAEKRKKVAEEVADLGREERFARYRSEGLDKDDMKAVEEYVTMRDASETVKAMKRMTKEKRKEVLGRLEGTMEPEALRELKEELRRFGVK